MRLIVTIFILGVSVLDFWFGAPGNALHFWGLAAGSLLALSLIIDRFRLARPGETEEKAGRLRSEPSE
jgi:hypothetical protein